jgi:hypothetical protein
LESVFEMKKVLASDLGSAHASGAGGGALAIANFSAAGTSHLQSTKMDCSKARQSAREARALPRICRHAVAKSAMFLPLIAFLSCETANYAPSVGSTSRDASRLERGRTLFVHRCIECHTLPPIWKYSHEDWPKIVNDMSYRASLRPAERDAVVAYILAVRKGL